VAFPEGIAMMPAAPAWSVLFFVMLFTLGVDSQFAMVETIVTAVVDELPLLKKGRRKIAVVGVFCLVMFLVGLPQCSLVSPGGVTNGGGAESCCPPGCSKRGGGKIASTKMFYQGTQKVSIV